MFKRIRARLDGNTEQGFTLIELLVVIIIIGILLAIAVPSYLGFRDRAANNAAKANLRAALPSAEAYYADNGTYAGMDAAALKLVDSGVSGSLTVASAAAATYCLTDTVSGKTWSVKGPGPQSSSFVANNNCTGAP
jgi:type IV pilus assembly protein PilA